MKYQYDKNGIKILPPQRKGVAEAPRGCWKVIYVSQETAERKAAAAHDLRGDYVAYKCPRYNHWHIGHKPLWDENDNKEEQNKEADSEGDIQ